jgi:hypothetical protein
MKQDYRIAAPMIFKKVLENVWHDRTKLALLVWIHAVSQFHQIRNYRYRDGIF